MSKLSEDELVKSARNIVFFLARRHHDRLRDRGMPARLLDMDTFTGEGFLGLSRAVRTWQPEGSAAKFSTYAWRCIDRAIFNYVVYLKAARRSGEVEDSGNEDDEGHCLRATSREPDPAHMAELREDVMAIKRLLTKDEFHLLWGWVVERKTAVELAGELNLSPEQVRSHLRGYILPRLRRQLPSVRATA